MSAFCALGLLGSALWQNPGDLAAVVLKSDPHGAAEVYLSTFHRDSVDRLFEGKSGGGGDQNKKSDAKERHCFQDRRVVLSSLVQVG